MIRPLGRMGGAMGGASVRHVCRARVSEGPRMHQSPCRAAALWLGDMCRTGRVARAGRRDPCVATDGQAPRHRVFSAQREPRRLSELQSAARHGEAGT